MKSALFLFTTVFFLLLFACTKPDTGDRETSTPEAPRYPEALPFQTLPLGDLSAFRPTGANWQVAGNALSDYTLTGSLDAPTGSGVLVNQMTETAKDNLFTTLEHGDIDLEIEFLMPKGSNSGIYFQGRYEVQLFDSWGVEAVTHGDCGGIYQRWDEGRPEGQKGYEGHAPRINASKAPGLWQHFRISFRAPQFDAAGNKVQNARFREVWHNGMLIHENLEVNGPTRSAAFDDEAPLGPLMIQGDHGPVAFRNIRYKAYGSDSLRLSDIRYRLYKGGSDHIPAFDTLTLVREGSAHSLDVDEVSDIKDHFAIQYAATLHVPATGDYLFKTAIDDGGDLFIDDQLVVHNEQDPGYNEAAAIIPLTQGEHSLRLTFYEEVWSATLALFYEGPGMEYRRIGHIPPPDQQVRAPRPPILVQAATAPEMLRGFVMYGEEKRTHTISVGDPAAVHYSYDLHEGALLKCWKGGFGDVTDMWQDRGEPQLLHPLNAAIALCAGTPVAALQNEQAAWPASDADARGFKGYQVNAAGRPVFRYEWGSVSLTDELSPADEGKRLHRSLLIEADAPQSAYWCRIAEGARIEQVPGGLYRIDGSYYLDLETSGEAEPLLRSVGDRQELLVPVLSSTSQSHINYDLLW